MKKIYTVLVLLFSMSLSFGQTITTVWTYSMPEKVSRTGPAIASDGTIYIGCNYTTRNTLGVGLTENNFFAINPNNTLKWQISLTEGAAFDKVDAIESSPSISSDGSIYMGGHFGRRLYKINPATGAFITRDLGSRIRYSAAAFANDGTVYQGTRNNGVKGFRSLTADLATENWVYPAAPGTGIVDFNSTPAIAKDGTIYAVATNNTVYALKPNGDLKWTAAYSASGGFASSAIALANDGTVYVSAKLNTPVAPDTLADGILMALNPVDGSVKWSVTLVDTNVEQGGPAVAADGTVYLGNNGGFMRAYNPNTGAQLWSFPASGGIEVVPAIDNLGRLYFGTTTGNFYVLNSDGTEAYTMLDLGDRIDSSAAIDKDGSIYVGATLGTGTGSGKLYKLQTTATGLQTGGWPMYAGNLRHTSNSKDITLSVVDNTIDGFNVYPNPVTNGEINITTAANGTKSVQLFDVLGKQVYSKKIEANETIKTSNFGAGVYILKVEENGNVASRKLIIN
jgi:outer membrane protein assembly factor BamB